jgi:hypothetical protein
MHFSKPNKLHRSGYAPCACLYVNEERPQFYKMECNHNIIVKKIKGLILTTSVSLGKGRDQHAVIKLVVG